MFQFLSNVLEENMLKSLQTNFAQTTVMMETPEIKAKLVLNGQMENLQKMQEEIVLCKQIIQALRFGVIVKKVVTLIKIVIKLLMVILLNQKQLYLTKLISKFLVQILSLLHSQPLKKPDVLDTTPIAKISKNSDMSNETTLKGVSRNYLEVGTTNKEYTFSFVELTNLEPDTVYYYTVTSGSDENIWSNVTYFKSLYDHT